jgi:glycerophosphoryl diester phosphodiesterase
MLPLLTQLSLLPLLIGHRGIPEFAPENSITGAILAKKMNVGCIEVDAMLCRDNRSIIYHDESLKRCSGIDGMVSDYDYNELLKFGICENFHLKNVYSEEQIPLMREMILKCRDIDLLLNIEIKCEESDLFSANVICKEIEKYGNPEQIVISSYNINALKFAKQILPKYQRNYIVDKIPSNWLDIVYELECSAIVVSYDDNSMDSIIELLKYGIRIYVFTINDLKTYRKLNSLGIGVFSDRPYTLSKYL